MWLEREMVGLGALRLRFHQLGPELNNQKPFLVVEPRFSPRQHELDRAN